MSGTDLIAAERQRQIYQEDFSHERDDGYVRGDLVAAAICYADEAGSIVWGPDGIGDCPVQGWAPEQWPWDPSWWKPSADPIRNLEKAGALIAAEIDRHLRARDRRNAI